MKLIPNNDDIRLGLKRIFKATVIFLSVTLVLVLMLIMLVDKFDLSAVIIKIAFLVTFSLGILTIVIYLSKKTK